MTLVELMVVVVIISILAVIVGMGLTRPTNASAARGLAHKVWVALRSARSIATSTGAPVRVYFAKDANGDGRSFTISRDSVVGPTPTGPWITVSRGQASGSAKIKCVTPQADAKATNATAGTCILPRTLFVYPDGRAGLQASASPNGATVYVQDGEGKYQHKIYIYKLTGFSRQVTNW